MKRIALSVLTIATMSNLTFAGGDLVTTEPVISVPACEVIETEKNFYVGLGFSALGTGTDSVNVFSEESGQDRTGNVLFLAGYEFNPYIAVEGRYSTYMTSGDILNSDTWGIYAKPQYPVSEDFKVYALLGFGGMTVDGINGAAINVDDNGFQWGLGASYGVTEEISIFLDYVSIATDMTANTWLGTAQDVDADAVTLGVTYHF